MGRLSRPVLVAVVLTFVVSLGATGATAAVAHKPLPQDACNLVDVAKLDAALGVQTDAPTPQVQPEAVACTVPIPYDPESCVVQPAPRVFVAAGKQAGDPTTLKEAATLARQQDFEVKPLKGKAYGKKGAFVVVGNGWTFYGAKGPYFIQIEAYEPCGSVSDEQLETAVQTVAKGVVKQL